MGAEAKSHNGRVGLALTKPQQAGHPGLFLAPGGCHRWDAHTLSALCSLQPWTLSPAMPPGPHFFCGPMLLFPPLPTTLPLPAQVHTAAQWCLVFSMATLHVLQGTGLQSYSLSYMTLCFFPAFLLAPS